MTFSELRNEARKRQFTEVHFIFQNTVGTILHGEWIDSSSFMIFESKNKGIINVNQWISLGGENLSYVIIPEGEKPLDIN